MVEAPGAAAAPSAAVPSVEDARAKQQRSRCANRVVLLRLATAPMCSLLFKVLRKKYESEKCDAEKKNVLNCNVVRERCATSELGFQNRRAREVKQDWSEEESTK